MMLPVSGKARRLFSVTTVAAVLLALVSSTTGVALSAPSAQRASAGNTIQIGIWQEPDFLNWLVGAESFSNYAIWNTLYDPPLTVLPNGSLQPDLLTVVPTVANGGVSKDGLTYTLHLRHGLRWSDGAPLTMQDYAFTAQLVNNPKVAAGFTAGWNRIKKVDTPDPYTAIVHLNSVYSPFVNETLTSAFSYWMPKHVLSKPGADLRKTYGRNPVGNGPFRFVSWTSGDNMVLERNPYYWRPVHLAKLIYRFFPDRNTIIAQLKAGNIDGGVDMIEPAIGQLAGTPNLTVYAASSANVEIYYLNFNDPTDLSKPNVALSDVRVRLALAEAIDRFSIVKKLLFGKAKAAVNYLDNSTWFNTALKPYPFDPANARKLLDAAGWKVGSDGIRAKNGTRLSLMLTTTAGNQLRAQVEAIVQDELRQVGVEIKIRNYPPTQLFGSLSSGGITASRKFDIAGYTDSIVGVDPDMSPFWTREQTPSKANGGAGFNIGGFYDPKLEQIVNAQLRTADIAQRKALLVRAQALAYKDVPAIFMYDRLDIFAANSHLSGVRHTDNAENAYLWNTWQWQLH